MPVPVSQFEALRRRYENKSVSDRTRRAISETLKIWDGYLRRRGKTWEAVTVEVVTDFRDSMIQGREGFRKLSPATVAQRLSIVRTLYAMATEEGLIARNPAASRLVPPPKPPEFSRTVALEPRDVRRILAAPDKTTLKGLRDSVILNLLARLALRRAEVSSLKNGDVLRIDARTPEGLVIHWGLRVKVKGGRERLLPLPEDVKDLIDAYRILDDGNRRSLRSHLAESPLIQGVGGTRTQMQKPISEETVRRTVEHYAEYCGIQWRTLGSEEKPTRSRVTPHTFRHTAVTLSLDLGIPIRDVMAMTGHRSPTTLIRYDSNKNSLTRNAINHLNFTSEK